MVTPLSHSQAAQIVRDEWRKIWNREATKLETLYTLAIAHLETGYGRIGQFAKMADEGIFNWANGEIPLPANGTCPSGYTAGVDNGKNVCFRTFHSDNEAANYLIRLLTKKHWPVIQAIADEGTPEAVAHAMKAPPAYYSAPESTYAAGLKSRITLIGNGLAKELESPKPIQTPEDSGFFFKSLAITGMALGTWFVARQVQPTKKGRGK